MAQDDEGGTGRLTRRSVVRVGSHAMWMVPVIVAVSAVPAYAASGGALAATLLLVSRTPSPTNVGNLNTLMLTSVVTDNGNGDQCVHYRRHRLADRHW